MARLARVVVPGHPHHVTQRGNGRARTFFGDDDYALYRDLLAEDCRWSSARAHLRGKADGVTALSPIRDRFPRFADLLDSEPEMDKFARLRAADSIGRPLGNERFVARLERLTGRALKPGKRGPK